MLIGQHQDLIIRAARGRGGNIGITRFALHRDDAAAAPSLSLVLIHARCLGDAVATDIPGEQIVIRQISGDNAIALDGKAHRAHPARIQARGPYIFLTEADGVAARAGQYQFIRAAAEQRLNNPILRRQLYDAKLAGHRPRQIRQVNAFDDAAGGN